MVIIDGKKLKWMDKERKKKRKRKSGFVDCFRVLV